VTVTRITPQDSFVLTLSEPAEVNDAGEAVLCPENLAPAGSRGVQSVFGRTGEVEPEAGDYAASEVTNDSSVGGETVGEALDVVNQGVTELQERTVAVTVGLRNIVSATAEVYRFVSPVSGTIVGADLVASANIAAGNLTVTLAINGSAVTGGVMTVLSGSPAGTVAAANPTAANAVSARASVVSLTVGGGNTAAGYAEATVLILPSILP